MESTLEMIGYYTAKTTGDGNCLYSAVSLSLFGEESHSPLIRLAAVCHAVEHFHHYSDMVIIAQSFTCTIVQLNLNFYYSMRNPYPTSETPINF